MRKFLFFFAVSGWTLGLLVHILSLLGIDVTEKFPFVWILHLGIFVVWILTILELQKNKKLKEFRQSAPFSGMNPITFLKIIFHDTPTWLIIVAISGFLYAIINFMLFISSQPGVTSVREGEYILHNHGQLIRTLTEEEYHQYNANDTRGFSGHWIAFYGIAVAALFPFYKQNKNALN